MWVNCIEFVCVYIMERMDSIFRNLKVMICNLFQILMQVLPFSWVKTILGFQSVKGVMLRCVLRNEPYVVQNNSTKWFLAICYTIATLTIHPFKISSYYYLYLAFGISLEITLLLLSINISSVLKVLLIIPRKKY